MHYRKRRKRNATARSLQGILVAYTERNAISASATYQYQICLNLFDQWLGRPATIRDLTFKTIRDFLRYFRESGRAAKTTNNRRQTLLMLWRFAARRKWIKCPRDDEIREELPKLTEPKRLPVAWSLEELAQLRRACESAPAIPRFGPALWDGRHWLALVLTIWDTAHRLDALLSAPRSALDARGYLRIEAEATKSQREQIHELAPETVESLHALPASDRLFAWPYKMRQLWIRYERDVLIPSGLPFDRLRKFHCLRKTSASHLCAAADEYAAMKHLGHASIDVTRASYLDPSIAYRNQSAARILPRF